MTDAIASHTGRIEETDAEGMAGEYLEEKLRWANAVAGSSAGKQIVVVGAGPVGLRLVNKLLALDAHAKITLFGNEPYQPYNRVQLSSVLALNVGRDQIYLPMPDCGYFKNFRYVNSTIVHIDKTQQQLTDNLGQCFAYDALVLAVGSSPIVPGIPGKQLKGVFTFRNLKDTDALYARLASAKQVVVVGGGLLGVEAAKALRRSNTQVTIVQRGDRLMNQQLDHRAGVMLQEKIKAYGIEVMLGAGVKEVCGEQRVTGVLTTDGQLLKCDTVLFCTGVKPNTKLALLARLPFNRGIKVDNYLQTREPGIYAIGECCEYEKTTFGLVSPGLEQASVLADRLCGGNAQYLGSLDVARLKVVGQSLTSIGEAAEPLPASQSTELVYEDKQTGRYRKLVFQRNRLIGALAFGEWDEVSRIQEALQQARRIPIWNRIAFRLTGNLWAPGSTRDVAQWPGSAIVCQCHGICVTALLTAMDSGSETVVDLQKNTGAGTVCGSCKPLLAQLTGDQTSKDREIAWLPTLLFCCVAVVLALTVLLVPGREVSDSVQQTGWFEAIWNDKYYKQVTGFSLLGLSVLGLLFALRKRQAWLSFGKFSHWRLFHIVLGVACATVLFLHTGLHLGVNLNRLLVVDFLAIVVVGSAAGTVISLSHKLSYTAGKKTRELFSWLHIILTWPLPVLLGMHIFSVYYF